ncbi:MAG: UDP-3-O-(3-hydroxymyristoyl)glucosamine N-acyltransferase [Kiritimatiellaeota bacterium]|nr:UDP-3-O-(3-hydroxymyristoyl)glucosamine N-acyltransferase [Kiritimatiellota bacterium]
MTVADIAAIVSGTVEGNAGAPITGVAALRDALEGDVSFLANPKYAPQVAASEATAIFVTKEWKGESRATLIRVEHPDRAFAAIVPRFMPPPVVHPSGIHPTAVVGEDVVVGDGVSIGPYSVIGKGCRLGARCVIEAHVVLGEGCVLGDDVHLYPMVSVRERIRMGNRVTVHNGSVIGSDGYGYTIKMGEDGTPIVEKIAQLGIVELCDDVEIGANVTIDRARFGVTRLGRSVKVDNLVQIAHNVQVGECTGIVSQVGISGSTHVGKGVMLWGQAGIAGHLNIGDGAQVLAQSGITKDVPAGTRVMGSPAIEQRDFIKTLTLTKAVGKLKQRLADLESTMEKL